MKMNNMKRINRLLFVILLLITSVSAAAQQVQIDVKFLSATGENTEYFDIPVQSTDGTWHAIEKINTEIILSVLDSKYKLVEYSLVLKRGSQTEGSWSTQTDAKIEAKGLDKSGNYIVELSNVVLSSTTNNTTVRDTLYKDTQFQAATFKLELYDVPEVTSENITKLSSEVIWSSTQRSFSVSATEGNETGWKYSWYIDNNKLSSTSNAWQGTIPVNNNRQQEFKAEVVNIAPDGRTEWFRGVYQRSFTVYQTPTAELLYNGTSCPTFMDWYCEDQNVSPIEVKTTGGSSNWSYSWNFNGDKYSGKSFTPEVANSELIINNQDFHYTVVVSNNPDGMSAALAKEADITIGGTICFFKTPEVTFDNTGYTDVFEGNDVIMTFQSFGGYYNGWSFSTGDSDLYFDGEKYIYNAENVSQNSEDKVITISYTNTLEGGYSSISGNTQIPVKIWNTPQMEMYYKSNNSEISQNFYRPINNNVYVNSAFGGSVMLGVEVYGGDENSWTYEWYENDYYTNSSTKNTEQKVDISGVETIEYKLVATNQPNGVAVPYTSVQTFTLHALEAPTYHVYSGSNVYAQVAGKKVQPSFGTNGGYNNGWEYVWYDEDGNEISRDLSASIAIPDNIYNKSVIYYDVVVSNYGPEGDLWFDGTSDENKLRIKVNAYPSPYSVGNQNFSGFDSNRRDAYFNDENQYVSFSETYTNVVPEATWEYSVYKDYGYVSNANNYQILIDNPYNQESLQTNIEMRAKCSIYDSESGSTIEAYNESRNLNFYSWSKGNVTNNQNKVHFQYNESVELNSNVLGGYESGWQFEWLNSDYTSIGGLNSSSYSYTNRYVGSIPNPITYYLHCKNTLNGVVGYEAYIPFNFTVYPQAHSGSFVNDYTEKLSSDDVQTVHINLPSGGNIDGWRYSFDNYSWHNITREDILNNTIYQESYMVYVYGGFTPYKEEQYKTVYFRNYSPDGYSIWSSYQDNISYTVHRRPEEPVYKKKNEKLYIANVDNATRKGDSQYENYSFEYGQRINGSYTINAKKADMYFQYPNKPTNPCVRSVWSYVYGGETFYTYSDWVQLGGANYIEVRALAFQNGSFSAVLEEEQTALVTIYSSEGKVVKQQSYPAQTEFNEQVDFTGLEQGIYIVKCVVGNQQVVNKVMVQ